MDRSYVSFKHRKYSHSDTHKNTLVYNLWHSCFSLCNTMRLLVLPLRHTLTLYFPHVLKRVTKYPWHLRAAQWHSLLWPTNCRCQDSLNTLQSDTQLPARPFTAYIIVLNILPPIHPENALGTELLCCCLFALGRLRFSAESLTNVDFMRLLLAPQRCSKLKSVAKRLLYTQYR